MLPSELLIYPPSRSGDSVLRASPRAAAELRCRPPPPSSGLLQASQQHDRKRLMRDAYKTD
eukprot:3946112-Pyramimonas_sp.AAC.1